MVATNINVLSEEKLAELDDYRPNGKAAPKPAEQPKSKPLFEIIESVTEEEIDCLWSGRLPRSKLSIFDGDAGVGKSTVALAIAATISRGRALPFDKEPKRRFDHGSSARRMVRRILSSRGCESSAPT